jgi:3-hydroxyacyl-CoA dehydrogenase
MIASGAPIGAQDALAAGLADAVAQGDVAGAAIRFLREKIEAGATTTPVIARDDKLNEIRADPARFEALATATAARARGLAAPLACIEAVRNAIDLPAETALKLEREIFLARVASSESKALRHLFFAEREAAKVPDIGKEVKPRPVERIGVIGAGTMGGGIAMAFANAGFPVTLLEMSEAALQRGFGLIEKNYAASVSRGSLSESARAERMARLGGATDYAALAGCDLIIEAVFEDMAVKKEVFGRIEAVAKPGAILATNTSYLDVDEIARATGRPADVVGLHFFSPANVMKLLEIVRGAGTAPDVVVTALSLARRIGKVPVVVGVCHGFVGNRIYSAYRREAEYIMEDGASPYEIDAALVAFGMPMGVFAVSDLSGLDISYATRRSMDATRDPDERYVRVADRLVEAGRLGRKSGAGYYSYAGGKPEPDPVTLRIVAEERAARGITPRPFSQEEIQQRLLAVMTQEGEKILRERIAQRASDIDLVMINGYGFPRSKGGPMWLSRQAAGDG